MRVTGKIFAGLALFFFGSLAAAQNVTTVTATITDTNGLPYSNATVQAQLLPSGITPSVPPPCNGQTASPCFVSAFQQATADVTGTFSMNLASNAVLVPGGTQWQFTINEIGIVPPAGTGPQTCSATVTISGALQSISSSFSACPALSRIISGTGALTNVTNTFTVPQIFGADLTFRGPNPRVYATAFHVRPVATGAIPSPTCTINIGAPTLATCSSVTGLQVFDGIDITQAGPTQSMPTPAAPTVTPACGSGLTGIGITVPVSGGGTSYAYSLAQRDTGQGITAASPDGTTTTGFAALGSTNTSITSTVPGIVNTMTSTVTSSANLAAGCTILINGSPTDVQEYGGWHIVTSIPDGTHVTWATMLDLNYGLTAQSSTGGTMTWWLCNHLTYAAGSGGGQQHFVFGRVAGSETLIGSTLIDTLGFTDAGYLAWDDYGPSMMASFVAPWFAPTTPPSSPVNDSLATTIAAINGNTLTLSSGASNGVTSVKSRFDNAPNILTGLNATNTFSAGGGGTFYIPPFLESGGAVNCYVTSSYMTFSAAAFEIGGNVCPGDTWQMNTGNLIGVDSSSVRLQNISFGYQAHTIFNMLGTNPGLWIKNSGNLYNLTMTNPGNGAVGIFNTAGSAQIFENMNFSSGNGTHDEMSIQFYDYHDPNVGGFGAWCIKCSYTTGMTLVDGSTATPLWVSKFSQEWNWLALTGSGRGFLVIPGNALFVNMEMGTEWNGGIMPLLTVINPRGGNIGGFLNIRATELDTMAHAALANLSNPSVGSLGMPVTIIGTNNPSSGFSLLTGTAFQGSINIMGFSNTSPAQLGVNKNFCTSAMGNAGVKGMMCSEFSLSSVLMSRANPTVSSGFGAAPSIVNPNGSGFFQVNVGTGGVASSGVIATNFTAAHNWNCTVANLTAHAGNRADDTVQTASTTTTITVQNQTKSTGAAAAWTASDILQLSCTAN